MMFLLLFFAIHLAAASPRGVWTAGARFDAMSKEVRADVNSYVTRVPILKRPLARLVLVHATAPCERVEIRDQGEDLAISCDDNKVAVANANGGMVMFTGDDGRTMELIHTIDGQGAIVQTFTSKHGTRVNRFISQADGGLLVEVTIASPRLDDPLHYQLLYSQ